MSKKKECVLKSTPARILLGFFDVFWIAVAGLTAFWFAEWPGFSHLRVSWPVSYWLMGNVGLAIALCLLFGLYSMIFSTAGFPEVFRILMVTGIMGVANLLFVMFIGNKYDIGYMSAFLFVIFFLGGLTCTRFLRRAIMSWKAAIGYRFTHKKRVMIVGCNNDAFTLIRNMVLKEKSLYKPVCLLDSDERYLGKRIYDLRVVGTPQDAKEVVKKYKIQEIFIAVSTKKAETSQILQYCRDCGCPMRLLPELSKMTHGEISVSQLRPVQIEDLLGREQVSVNLNEVMEYIEGKVVLVTGGGGSIGSELCRQIAMHSPAQLIILDIYENNAYDIEQELKRRYPKLNLLTLIASVRDKVKMRDVFDKHRPQIVFNAAAHKHVPLMETSPNEAVKNNVFGTLNVARAADEFGVETFVQISTDKAVNPTNIMGATKRICEMLIQTIGRHSKNTKFVAVRFGNVLGSNGSVIPLFKRQIAEGGPVTITHKDIIRYFMTIPEAVSLVLQAGAYAKSGQIFVLDMGEPVKIYDLAYNLIKLSGYEPNVDIAIECTGLRPGEKLYEERLMKEEGLQKTANGLINIAKPIPFDETTFWDSLDKLYEAAHSETDSMKEWVKELVPTYTIDKRESVAVQYIKGLNATENTQEKAENQ